MSLGSDILAALNALSESDKRDTSKCWEAIGGEIEDYPSGSQNAILDNRAAGDVTPDGLPDQAIFYTFTDDIAGSPNTWDAVINVKGWTDTYTAWQLFSNADAVDTDKNLYFRRGRNATWDALQKIWTDQNDGIDSGLNADLLDGYHGGSFFRLSQNEIVTGRPAFNGGVTGASSPFTVDSTFRVPNLNADFVDGIQGASFIRSDADYNVSAHTEWQDSKEIRLGNEADFRMLFSGTSTFFKGYYHGASLFFQGEDLNGDNQNMLVLDPDTGPILYYNGVIKLTTKTDGIDSTGKVSMPIGTMYIQFNGKSAPSSLFYGTWTDRSSTWAGRFFRATGGSAAAFGDAQADAFQGHWHRINDGSSNYGYGQTNFIGGTSHYGISYSFASSPYVKAPYTDGVNGTPRTASETRPVNYAVKIWERTS